jgi:hypothetical protein
MRRARGRVGLLHGYLKAAREETFLHKYKGVDVFVIKMWMFL